MDVDKLVLEAGDLSGFIEQFSVFASAPDGIKRLRNFILHLAVQGKLAEQDHQGNAESELKAIKNVRCELFKLKKRASCKTR